MFQKKIADFLQNNELCGSKISVAVSGGSDSVALFFALLNHQKQFSLSISIVHVNYHLRGEESDSDANFVKQLASQHNIPLHYKDMPISITDSGIEEKARDIRYRFFSELIQSGTCSHIAIGHTLEDQAETVLFRLVRGTSIHGISGMESVRSDGIIRPLLHLSRQECQNWLISNKQPWREDSSNEMDTFARNVIRHHVSPTLAEINNSAIDHICTFANHARTVHQDSILYGMKRLNELKLYESELFFHFHRTNLLDSIELAAISNLLRKRNCTISAIHAESIRTAGDRAGKTELLPSGWQTYSTKKRLVFFSSTLNIFENNVFLNSLYRFQETERESQIRPIKTDDSILIAHKEVNALRHLKKCGFPLTERVSMYVQAFEAKDVILPVII